METQCRVKTNESFSKPAYSENPPPPSLVVTCTTIIVRFPCLIPWPCAEGLPVCRVHSMYRSDVRSSMGGIYNFLQFQKWRSGYWQDRQTHNIRGVHAHGGVGPCVPEGKVRPSTSQATEGATRTLRLDAGQRRRGTADVLSWGIEHRLRLSSTPASQFELKAVA